MTPQDTTFSEIYAEHAPHVGRVARHFGVPGAQLPDVTQEVWLSVYRQLESVDLSRPLRPWLTGVVWNHVRHLRRSYARHARKEQALVVAEEVGGRTAETPTARTEAAWTLETVLGDLPEDQREVLLLCDGEGLSAPEVSEALGVQLNTVYSRLRLARRRCQSLAATLGAAGLALLFEEYCEQATPSAAELAAGASRIAAATQGMTPVVAMGGAGATIAAGSRSSGLWIPVTTIAAVVAGLVVAWQLRVVEAPGEAGPVVAAVSRPVSAAPVAEVVEVIEEVEEVPVVEASEAVMREPARPRVQRRRSAAVAAPVAPVVEAPASGRSSLNAEHRILADARAALSAGRTGEALALLGEHRRDFPASGSADTRDLMLVQIHCGRGDGARARAIAANYPGDPQFAALTGRRCG